MGAQAAILPPTKDMVPRDYQIDAYHAAAAAIREYSGPVFIEASVGAGKTMMMGMLLARAQQANMSAWVLARRGELVEQNAGTFWECGVKNSIYSASVGVKSTHYPVIVGSEGTISRAMAGHLKKQRPDILLIDECHEVDFTNPDCQYMQIINELLRRNHKLRIVGLTGSPYRGDAEITGRFWKKCVYRVRTEYLVGRGYLVPTIFGFGHDDLQYDLHEFKLPDDDKHQDYSQKEMLAMQRKILEDGSATQRIMAEVVALTKDRNAVMITGAGRRHLEEIAKCLPDGSWAIITDRTGNTERRESLKAVSRGEIKYLLQIGCLTVGYDEPLIDTSVIMRKISSLTLLVQLLGRGMRLFKQKHLDMGRKKDDHLVLDYTDTLAEMMEIYQNPILESAQQQKAKRENELIECPKCGTENSKFARRCIGHDLVSIDGRCEFFWSASPCPKCGTLNDKCARECRSCQYLIIDPNRNLTGKHYTDDDWREVRTMKLRATKSGDGLVVDYLLSIDPGAELQEGAKTREHAGEVCELATEVFYPNSDKQWAKAAWRNKFLTKHLHRAWWPRISGKHAGQIVKMAAMFDTPSHLTHRVNTEGKSIIHRKRFLSGRTEETG